MLYIRQALTKTKRKAQQSVDLDQDLHFNKCTEPCFYLTPILIGIAGSVTFRV